MTATVVEAVRVTEVDDWDAIAVLQSGARAALVEQRGGPEWLSEHLGFTEPEVASWIDDPDVRAAVATLDDVVVGHAITHLGTAGGVARVTWLYVEPGARELGLGEMLLADATEWATAVGASRIESTALPGDRETKNMFERFGMKARLLVVGRPLGEPAKPVTADAD